MRRFLLLLPAIWLVTLLPRAGAVRAQTGAPLIDLACTGDGSGVAFPLDGGTPPLLLPPAQPNAALDTGAPRRAVTCQAVVEQPSAPDPFSPGPGTVSFSLSGAAQFVESGAASATVACPCAATASDTTVAAPTALVLHVVQQPGTPLPDGPAPAAITLTASFQPADGSAGAAATAAIDLAPPALQLQLAAQPQIDLSGNYATVKVTLQVDHLVPDGCALIGEGPYVSCSTPVSHTAMPGAEAGVVSFTTSLGSFANGQQQFSSGCGEPPATQPVVPFPGVETPFPLACDTLAVSIALGGHVGDINVSASFSGAYTGARAFARAQTTVAPQPPSYRLASGCTQVSAPLELPPAAPVSLIAESVTPPEAVTGIWRRGADGGWQLGYTPDTATPLDFSTVTPGEALFVCVNAVAAYPLH